jgi:tRNA(Arg) A34 adenosine deaminase TadA
MGSVWAIHRHPVESKHTKVEVGCLEEECRELLREFFKNRRSEGET